MYVLISNSFKTETDGIYFGITKLMASTKTNRGKRMMAVINVKRWV